MTDQELLARTRRAFERAFGPRVSFDERVSRSSEPRWNSLKHVEFIIALEAEFGVRFDGADATDMTTVSAVLDRVRNKVS